MNFDPPFVFLYRKRQTGVQEIRRKWDGKISHSKLKPHLLRPTRSRVCRLTYSAWPRIQPELTTDEHFGFVSEYLLECLASNPNDDDEFLHAGGEAGHAIQSWLKYLVAIPEGRSVISDVATRLEELYRAGDPVSRNRIETAALEHTDKS